MSEWRNSGEADNAVDVWFAGLRSDRCHFFVQECGLWGQSQISGQSRVIQLGNVGGGLERVIGFGMMSTDEIESHRNESDKRFR